MATVGYGVLQVIPSLRGVDAALRRQLVDAAGDAGDQAGLAAGDGLRNKFAKGALVAGVAAGAVLIKGITQAIDQANITSTLQAQLGTSNKVAAAQGKVAGKLYSSGVSDSFQDAADAIKAVVQAGLAPPGTTNKQLQSIAAKASDVAKVFGQDLGGVTNAVSQMLRTGLAKNAGEAFDLITKGFQTGTDKGGDFLDTINEYGTQFRKAGLDGASAIGLLNQAIQAGARDSDIAADAIKEFSIRAVDGSKTSADGFKALGLNADDMAARFAKGGKNANAVLDLTLDRLRGIKDPVQQSQAAVALFGTQAEDLGAALLAMDPSSATAKLGTFSGAAEKMGKTIHSGPAHEIEVFTRTLQQGFVTFLGGTVLPVITDVGHWLNTYLLPPIRTVASAVAGVLVPALVGLYDGGRAVVNWLRDMGAWLIPVAVAVGGLTLALSANAIMTGIVTGVFAVYRAAILIGTAVTNGMAAAQAALNAVMALNPFVLVAIAVAALIAALVVAYQKSDTFRAIVQAAWEGIKTAALFVWNTVLKPIFAAFVTAFQAVATAAMWLWQNVLSPVFSFIAAAAKVLGIVLLIIVFGPIILGFKAVAAIAMWLWTNAIQPAFNFIAALAKWLWNNALRPAFEAIKAGIRVLGSVFRWLYNNVVQPVFTAVKTVISLWWTGVKVVFNAVVSFVRNTLGPVFRWLYNNVVKPVWDSIKSVITGIWTGAIRPAFNALKTAIGKVGDAFKNAKDAIKTAWNAIKDATKGPINWVIRVVWNEGIVSIWKKITGWIPGVPQLGKLKMLASGGTVGAGFGQPATPGVFNRPTAIVGEGNPLYPEFVIPTDPRFRGRALALWEAAGGRLMADGGILGDIVSGAKNIGGKVVGGIKSAADFLSDPLGAVAKLLNPLIDKAKGHLGGTTFGQMAAGLPRMVIQGLKDLVKNSVGKLFSSGSGGSGVKRWAPIVSQVLAMLKAPATALGAVLTRINIESGGNPNAINNWDINAKNGVASRGLMQVIPPTFAAYAGPFRGRGIFDPLANIYAGVNYAMHRYGANWIRIMTRPGGYDSGGLLPPGLSTVYNGTSKPEMVLTDRQWQAVTANARGGDGGDTYNFYPRTLDMTVRDLEVLQRRQDALARVGRPR
jgi:phage-related protein